VVGLSGFDPIRLFGLIQRTRSKIFERGSFPVLDRSRRGG
jgi:hypothetical protein